MKGNCMRKVKAVLDFVKLSEAPKVLFYRQVIDQMSGNSYFPTPDVPMTEAVAAVDALEAAISASTNGGHATTVAMYAQSAVTENIFRTLVAYVNRIADGNEVIITSSGFHESSQPVMTPKPVLSVTDGNNSGGVKLVAKAIEKAGAYIWQYAKEIVPATESGWITAGTGTRSTFEVGGLTAASRYYFRMAAITPNVVTNYCSPVLKIVV
jgi:hypothetical protein